MKFTSLLGVIVVAAGVSSLSYYIAKGPQEKHQREQSEFSQQILRNIAADHSTVTVEDKRAFVRYLGFPDSVRGNESLDIVKSRTGKDYDVMVDSKKLVTVSRETLEGYYPGREKAQ